MNTSIPTSMQAVLQERGGALTLGSIPIPDLGPGQVLVRMAAAPINPSDLGFIRGSYGFHTPSPVVPGFEGSGTVGAAGPGLLPRLWLGRRVACSVSLASGRGTWADYVVTSATSCFPLKKPLSWEQGAMLIVNPMTAIAFFDIAKRDRHAAIVSNAAASALGRMILRLGQLHHMPVIHIVRRDEQVALLRSLGGEYILNSSDPDFCEQLNQMAGQLKATLLLDAVGGEQTRQLLEAAPSGSTLLAYGSLSGEQSSVASAPSLADGKQVARFFLPDWLAKKTLLKVLLDIRRVQHLVQNGLQTVVQRRFPLPSVQQAIELYQANSTAGKVLLVANPATS